MLLLLVLVWLVYAPAKDFGLLSWDDDINLQANPHLTGFSWASLKWMFGDLTYQWRYQPLAWVTWFSLFELQGLNPFGYHLINILLHLANTVLVFLVVRQVFICAQRSAEQASVGGLIAAALWSLHPMRVELVAWAVELLYNQALFFLLLSYWAYLKRSVASSRTHRLRWYWLSFVCLVLSLFTFPLAMGFLGVLIVTDIYLLRQLPESPRAWLDISCRSVWREKLPFAVVIGLSVTLNLMCRAKATGLFVEPVSLAKFGLFPRFMQACYMWSYYLWRPFWPVDLTPVPTQLIEFDPLTWPFLCSFALVAGLTVWTFCYRRRNPWPWCAWLIYLVVLLPMLGLTEHPHFPSDRYSVIVSICLATLLASWCVRWWEETRSRWLLTVSVASVSVFLAVLSATQLPLWTNDTSFFNQLLVTLKDHPFRFNILTRVAMEYRQAGALAQAEKYAAQAIELRPEAALQRLWLGDWQMLQGKKAQARQTFLTGLVLQPESREFHGRLANSYAAEGRFTDAAKEFQAELQVSPHEFSLDFRYFMVLAQSGDLVQARQQYEFLQKAYGLNREETLACQVAVADGYAANGDRESATQIATSALAHAQEMRLKPIEVDIRKRLEHWRPARGGNPAESPVGRSN